MFDNASAATVDCCLYHVVVIKHLFSGHANPIGFKLDNYNNNIKHQSIMLRRLLVGVAWVKTSNII